jgi:putative chitinase
MITEPQLRAFLPLLPNPHTWVAALEAACSRFAITPPARLAAFLAQCAHESNEFKALIENLIYSTPERIYAVWPKRFPSIESARPYVRKPEDLANHVYAGRLGNGPQESGDGWRYRGRGLIQLTGRANYRQAGLVLQLPLKAEPHLVGEPNVAALTAAEFWHRKELNALADEGTPQAFDTISVRINGGTTGLLARRAFWQRAKAALAGAIA